LSKKEGGGVIKGKKGWRGVLITPLRVEKHGCRKGRGKGKKRLERERGDGVESLPMFVARAGKERKKMEKKKKKGESVAVPNCGWVPLLSLGEGEKKRERRDRGSLYR